jgi:hypothetical protein
VNHDAGMTGGVRRGLAPAGGKAATPADSRDDPTVR